MREKGEGHVVREKFESRDTELQLPHARVSHGDLIETSAATQRA